MKKIWVLTLVLVLLCANAMAGCTFAHRELDDIVHENKIVVATNAEFRPFEFKDGQQIVGIDIDIIRAYARHIGVQCQVNDMDFDSIFLSVYSGKADVAIAAVTVNDKRQRNFDFSDEYYRSAQMIIVAKNSVYTSAQSVEELRQMLSNNHATVGSQMGSVGEYYASGDSSWGFEKMEGVVSVAYETGALACKALAEGKIDAVVIDKAPGTLLVEKYPSVEMLNIVLTEESYAIAVQKGNESLLKSINEFIATIKADGTLEQIVVKYYA